MVFFARYGLERPPGRMPGSNGGAEGAGEGGSPGQIAGLVRRSILPRKITVASNGRQVLLFVQMGQLVGLAEIDVPHESSPEKQGASDQGSWVKRLQTGRDALLRDVGQSLSRILSGSSWSYSAEPVQLPDTLSGSGLTAGEVEQALSTQPGTAERPDEATPAPREAVDEEDRVAPVPTGPEADAVVSAPAQSKAGTGAVDEQGALAPPDREAAASEAVQPPSAALQAFFVAVGNRVGASALLLRDGTTVAARGVAEDLPDRTGPEAVRGAASLWASMQLKDRAPAIFLFGGQPAPAHSLIVAGDGSGVVCLGVSRSHIGLVFNAWQREFGEGGLG